MNLNKRLEKVASFVEDGSHIIDVGCDHALLAIALVQRKKNIRAIASDIKEGPLASAKKNVQKYRLEHQITLKLGRGITTIEEDIDTIIISGMGGLNIIGILKYNPQELKKVSTLILSPNNDTCQVRKEVSKLGFFIEKEVLVKEKEIIYPILVWKKGKKHYSYEQCLLGPILLLEKGDLFLEYIQKQQIVKEKLLCVLPKKYWQKRFQLKRELKIMTRIF